MQLGVCKHLYPQIILMSSQHPSAPAKGNGLSKDRFLFKRILKNPLQSHINGVIIKYNKYCKVRSGK